MAILQRNRLSSNVLGVGVSVWIILADSSTDYKSVWYDVAARTCFAQSDVRLSWPASSEQCQRLRGGHLAVVATAEQLSAVGKLAAAAGHPAAWIDGRREATTWKWSDGTLLGIVTYHHPWIKSPRS